MLIWGKYEHQRLGIADRCFNMLWGISVNALRAVLAVSGIGGEMNENSKNCEKIIKKYEFWDKIVLFLAFLLVLIAWAA